MPDTTAIFHRHDHALCRQNVLALADAQFRDGALRLTPVRRRTLEILLEKHQALGAYQVLKRLANEGFGAQPPVAYRALDFLCEQGFAHKVRCLNAYAACTQPALDHRPVFLICDQCNAIAEAPAQRLSRAMKATATDMNFTVNRMNMEATGLCPECRMQNGPGDGS